MYFLSYLLIFLGSLLLSMGILGRFIHREHVYFDLPELARFGVALLGLLILVGSILLYSYQFEIDQVWNSSRPTPTERPALMQPLAVATWHAEEGR